VLCGAEYVNVAVPVEVDATDTQRGGSDLNEADSGHGASKTGNRTSSASGTY